MASSFPTTLQDLDATRGTATQRLNNPSHVTHHTLEDDTIEALQAKVGIDSSVVITSLDYILKSTSSSNPGHKHTLANGATDVTSSATELNVLDGIPVTLTAIELGYVDGVTSAIQTQLDAKAPSASPTFTGTVTLPKTLEIQDTSADHQYVLAVSELVADRTVTLPLLSGNDEFVFKDHTQTLANKTLTSPLLQGSVDGWISANETWTYASASTITVPSGAASKYKIGDKIKWTQTTVKYGVIVTVADTLLTIAINTDYTVANAAISANYYSHDRNPIGFPDWFNFTAGETWTNPPTSRTTYCKYNIQGRIAMMIWGTVGTANGSNSSSTIILTVPANLIAAGVTRNPVLGSNLWTDNATFTDLGQIYSTAVGSITADFPSTTRKPTIVNISATWEI